MSVLASLKERMVDDWREASQWWSARFNAAGTVVYPLLISVQAMPPDVQGVFPLKYRVVVAGVYSLAALFARVYKQPRAPPGA